MWLRPYVPRAFLSLQSGQQATFASRASPDSSAAGACRGFHNRIPLSEYERKASVSTLIDYRRLVNDVPARFQPILRGYNWLRQVHCSQATSQWSVARSKSD